MWAVLCNGRTLDLVECTYHVGGLQYAGGVSWTGLVSRSLFSVGYCYDVRIGADEYAVLTDIDVAWTEMGNRFVGCWLVSTLANAMGMVFTDLSSRKSGSRFGAVCRLECPTDVD